MNIDKDIEILEELAEDTIRYKMVETDAYTADAITRVLKELKTYKKIAEKLADYGFNCYYGSPLKFDSPEELIEVARKETEDEELARKEEK